MIEAMKIEATRLREAQSKVDDLQDEIKALQIKLRLAKQDAESIKDDMLQAMQHAGETRFIFRDLTITRRKGQPVVVVDNLEALPPQFIRTKVEANKVAIKEALKATGATSIDGAHLVTGPDSIVTKWSDND